MSDKAAAMFNRLKYNMHNNDKTYKGKTRDRFIPVPAVEGGTRVTVESSDIFSMIAALARRVEALEG